MTVLLAARGAGAARGRRPSAPGRVPLVADVVGARRPRAAGRGRAAARAARPARQQRRHGGGTTAVDIDVARASRVLEINFLAHVGLTRALWGSLLASRGAVLNVSSGLGTYVHPRSAAYAASKHAVTAWSRALRVQGLREGVRVLTLNPGPVVDRPVPARRAGQTALRPPPADRRRTAAPTTRFAPSIGDGPRSGAIPPSPDRERAVDRAGALRALPRAAIPVATRTARCRRSRPAACPGGIANSALVVCWMYSLSASCAAEPALDRGELRVRVALEGDEEQPGVELARGRVDPVGERVAAAQDADRRCSRDGAASRMCASTSITGVPSASLRREIDRRRARACPSSGAPDCLEAADHLLLVAERRRGPRPRSACGCGARRGRCRRGTSAAARRRRPTRSARICAVVVAVEVVRAVLEAHQVARRDLLARRRRRAAEAELRPAQHGRAARRSARGCAPRGTRPDGIVRAGLDAEVAVRARRVELLARQRAERPQRARPAGARPKRSAPSFSNTLGPSPNVIVRSARRAARRPRPCRPAARRAARLGAERLAGGHLRGRVASRLRSRSRSSAAVVEREVERGEHEPVLRRRRDARLVRAVERHDRRSPRRPRLARARAA